MSAKKRSTKPSKKTPGTARKKSAGKVAKKAAKKAAKKTTGKVAKKPAGKAAKKVARTTTRKRTKKVAKKAATKQAKKVATKSAGKSQKSRTRTELSPADRHAMIAEAAYYRAESRNFGDGDPVVDWLASEKEVDAVLHAPG